jgi:hypothetical protein
MNKVLDANRATLNKVAEALKRQTSVPTDGSPVDFVFVGLNSDTDSFVRRYRALQQFFFDKFGVELIVVGGGFGCEKAHVRISGPPEFRKRAVNAILDLNEEVVIECEKAQIDRIFERDIGQNGGLAVESAPKGNDDGWKRALKIKNPVARFSALTDSLKALFEKYPESTRRVAPFLEVLHEIHSRFASGTRDISPGHLTQLRQFKEELRKAASYAMPIFESIEGAIESFQMEMPTPSSKAGTYILRHH